MKLQLILLASLVTGSNGGIPVTVEECLLDIANCVGSHSTMCSDYAAVNICEHGACMQLTVQPHYYCNCTEADYVLSADDHYCFYDPVTTSDPAAAPGTTAPGTTAPGTPAPAAAPGTPAPGTPAPGTPAPAGANAIISCPSPNGCASNSIGCEMKEGLASCLCEDEKYVYEYEACQNITACYPVTPCSAAEAECIINEGTRNKRPECWCTGDVTPEEDYKIAFWSETC